jgi:hypothetical protein
MGKRKGKCFGKQNAHRHGHFVFANTPRDVCHIMLDKCLSTYIAFVSGGNHVFETYLLGEGI